MPNLPGPGLTRGAVLAVALAGAGCTVPRTPSPFVPLTVLALFAKVEDAIDRDADRLDVRYDPRLGYPLEIAIDFIERAIDDEVTYTAAELAAIR